MTTDNILELKEVTVNFDGFKALNKVNLAVKYGELRVLIGPNGAGKTTIFDAVSGKVRPEKGEIFFRDNNIAGQAENKIANLGIARKFQTPTIFDNLTIFENMELAAVKNKGVFNALCVSISSEEIEGIHQMLETVGLEKKYTERAGVLAHGEKQWLEIGMSMVRKPALLLVDEPAAGMTGRERDKTGELLKSIARLRTVLVVEHDMEFIRKIAEKVTVLHEGSVLCEGTMAEVQNNPVVIDVYLGRTEEG